MTDWFYIHYSLKHYQAKCSGLSTFGVYVVIKQIRLYGSTQMVIQFCARVHITSYTDYPLLCLVLVVCGSRL